MMERLTRRNNKGIVGIKGHNGLLTSYCYYCTEELEDGIWLLEDTFKKLAEYEDLEEQGLLLRLPCKVGDTFYELTRTGEMYQWEVVYFEVDEEGVSIFNEDDYVYYVEEIGKTVFFTREEAEAKLKEWEGKE